VGEEVTDHSDESKRGIEGVEVGEEGGGGDETEFPPRVLLPRFAFRLPSPTSDTFLPRQRSVLRALALRPPLPETSTDQLLSSILETNHTALLPAASFPSLDTSISSSPISFYAHHVDPAFLGK